VRLSADGESVTLLTIYRPGSAQVTNAFFDELTTVVESLVLQSKPVIVVGDINIYVDDSADADAARLAALFNAFDLQLHVVGANQNLGGTLDIVVTFSGYCIHSLAADPPGVISDHSLLTCCLPAHHCFNPRLTRLVRSWRRVDRLKFVQAVKNSAIGCLPSPSQSVDELFAMYNNSLRDIADRRTWFTAVSSRSECREIRRDCRRLERRYRRTKSDFDRSNFIAAQRHKHDSFVATNTGLIGSRLREIGQRKSGSRYSRYCGETKNWTVSRRLRRTTQISLSCFSATKSRQSARTRQTVRRRHLQLCGRPSHR